MRATLEDRCGLFIENRDIIRDRYKWENAILYPICANAFCVRGKTADPDRLRQCDALLKSRTGAFSNFRGSVRLPVLSMLAAGDAPEADLEQMLVNYELLKKHFSRSEYLALAALLLAQNGGGKPADDVAQRARAIYERIRREHPFLTGSEDSVLSVLLALSDKDELVLIAEMEDCYKRLKPTFGSGNDLQGATHVLALAEGATLEKCARLIALSDSLRAAGARFRPYRMLPLLAALSVLPVEISEATADVMDVYEYLRPLKGYRGIFGADRRTRLSHAVMLTADEYAPGPEMNAAAIGGTLAAIAAQQAAMCTVMISSTVTNASSH